MEDALWKKEAITGDPRWILAIHGYRATVKRSRGDLRVHHTGFAPLKRRTSGPVARRGRACLRPRVLNFQSVLLISYRPSRVRAAFWAASERPRGPLVAAALRVARWRSARPRCRAALRVWRARARALAAALPSRFKTARRISPIRRRESLCVLPPRGLLSSIVISASMAFVSIRNNLLIALETP
jgi:hypothetical protein